MNLQRISWPPARVLTLLAALCLAWDAKPCSAAYMFSATGTITQDKTDYTVSTQAVLSIDKNGDLVIVLTNTTAGGTLNQASALTGLFFNIAGSDPTLNLTSATGTTIFGNGTAPDPDGFGPTNLLNSVNKGGWLLDGEPGSVFGTTSTGTYNYEYGISTVGIGVFGDGVNGPTYGIIAPTNPFLDGLMSNKKNTKYFVDTTATFVITGFSGSLDQIQEVGFIFGSEPSGVFNVHHSPEPMSLLSFGLGGIGLLAYRWRRRRLAKVA